MISLSGLGETCASGGCGCHAHGNIFPAPAAQHQRVLAVHVLREQHLAVPLACTDGHAQVVRARAVHQFRILHAEAVAPGEAAAIEHLRKLRAGPVHVEMGIVQRGAVDGGGERHVLRPLEPALDLQTVRTGLHEGIEALQTAQILRGEQVALHFIHAILHTAGLGAEPAVAAAAADHAGEQALA